MKRLVPWGVVICSSYLLGAVATFVLLAPFDDLAPAISRSLGTMYMIAWAAATVVSVGLIASGQRVPKIVGAIGVAVVIAWFGVLRLGDLLSQRVAGALYVALFVGQVPVAVVVGIVGLIAGIGRLRAAHREHSDVTEGALTSAST